MHHFDSTLLREKFVIKEISSSEPADDARSEDEDTDEITALSNRMALPFRDKDGRVLEEFIVRTKTMQSCIRLSRHIVEDYTQKGSLTARMPGLNWSRLWEMVETTLDEQDPDLWCVVYHDGKAVFSSGDHHPFLDVIEKFANKFNDEYEQSVMMAEKAFMKAGKKVNINHDSKIAAIIDINKERAKCGIIIRSPKRTTTCNIHVSEKYEDVGYFIPAFDLCAELLEGIHYSFIIGHNEKTMKTLPTQEKISYERKVRNARNKIHTIQKRINNIEEKTDIHYRPEKPSFKSIIQETMDYS